MSTQRWSAVLTPRRPKVFFRRVALEELEASRGRVVHVDRKLTKLQAAVRSMTYRKRFLHMKSAAITVQARGRALILIAGEAAPVRAPRARRAAGARGRADRPS
eukprot:COSAG02_NODE_2162_length_9623_cov_3.592923_4_plen_104_part_00